jgi:hypothetical protein
MNMSYHILDGLLQLGGGFLFIFLMYSFYRYLTKDELRKSALKDMERGNYLSAKLKFKEMGDLESVREIEEQMKEMDAEQKYPATTIIADTTGKNGWATIVSVVGAVMLVIIAFIRIFIM